MSGVIGRRVRCDSRSLRAAVPQYITVQRLASQLYTQKYQMSGQTCSLRGLEPPNRDREQHLSLFTWNSLVLVMSCSIFEE